nr:retrotransposon protein, putative, Ty1-copia subclass [Tanacetum cinerariifolium]
MCFRVCSPPHLYKRSFDFGGRDDHTKFKERSKAKGDDGEGLYVRERTDHRDSRQSKGNSRSKSRCGRLKQSQRDGSRVILSGIRRDNCVYSLDGHAMTCELNASVEEKDSLAQLVENQTGGTVKKLRKDNGLEFCNREFEQLCIESGSARHLIVFGTPQQNEVAERMNRTLMDKTPMEMWSEHPSDYEMLRIFGCVAYPHDKQGKLEPRAIKCVLLGYPEGVKGYRLYRLDDESPKIVTRRNVVFNESVMYKDTLKDSDASNKSVEELQVEVELQRLNNHALEKDQTDQEDGDDEDAGDQATDQPPDLIDYQL